MTSRAEVLLWAKRIGARRAAEPHVVLEISAEASLETAQQAFHAIARNAHPDLYRTACTADELELITTAFALVANAYQQFRAQRLTTTKMPALKEVASLPPAKKPGAAAAGAGAVAAAKPGTPGMVRTPSAPIAAAKAPSSPIPAGADAAVLVPEPGATPASQMSARAAVHYRKAELSLRRGDVPAGILHMKMAIAADPTSKFLRQALAQIEAELKK